MAFWKESMINRLSNLINRNRSAAKISQVLCSSENGNPIGMRVGMGIQEWEWDAWKVAASSSFKVTTDSPSLNSCCLDNEPAFAARNQKCENGVLF